MINLPIIFWVNWWIICTVFTKADVFKFQSQLSQPQTFIRLIMMDGEHCQIFMFEKLDLTGFWNFYDMSSVSQSINQCIFSTPLQCDNFLLQFSTCIALQWGSFTLFESTCRTLWAQSQSTKAGDRMLSSEVMLMKPQEGTKMEEPDALLLSRMAFLTAVLSCLIWLHKTQKYSWWLLIARPQEPPSCSHGSLTLR